jgi:hypothetical protein
MPDVESPSSGESEGTELEEDKPEESEPPKDGVKPQAGDPGAKAKTVPYSRFQEVNRQAREYEKVVKWYQENIKDADELLAFKKWQAEVQAKSANEKSSKTDDEPLDAKKAEEIRKLLRKADPETAKALDELRQSRQEAEEAMFDRAEAAIRRLAPAYISSDEDALAKLGKLATLEILDDKKLLRQWRTGDVSCVEEAYKRIEKVFFDKIRRNANGHTAETKRRASSIPKILPGSSTTSTKGEDPLKGKGLTKDVGKAAWAYLKSLEAGND